MRLARATQSYPIPEFSNSLARPIIFRSRAEPGLALERGPCILVFEREAPQMICLRNCQQCLLPPRRFHTLAFALGARDAEDGGASS